MALSSPKPDAKPGRLFSILAIAFLAVPFSVCTGESDHQGPIEPDISTTQDTININSATASGLERLEGIGPRTAEKIVKHRNVFGAFQRPAEIMLVEGIGEKQFLKIRNRIRTK